jgi:hypothetical protein
VNKALTFCAAVVLATVYGCASKPPPAEGLQSVALNAAQQRGAADLGCPAATAQILSKETIQEAQGTGWYEYPHKAAYKMDVSGCGKRTTYSLTCDDRQQSCVTGPVTVSSAPRQLADELQPSAVRAAQQRGSSELGCEAVTTRVVRQETIQEAQATGWSEFPHKAAYTVDVSGCGKRSTYSVACDDREKDCVAGVVQKKTEGGPPQLADKLQPDAVNVAQQRGAVELGCPAATAEVLRQETIENGQTTGWYEPPHRAAYSIAVSGCGKRTTYVVSCDDRNASICVAGRVVNTASE